MVHPNNPTGSFVKPAEAVELGRICASNELAIIADEVFLDYSLKTPQQGEAGAPSFASGFDAKAGNEALTFTLSGLSKIAGLPQMKVAWIA